MKYPIKPLLNTLWFVIEVVAIFALVQAVRYAFGNWDAVAIGLSLLAIALILFIAAYLSAIIKDKRDGNKPTHRISTRILS